MAQFKFTPMILGAVLTVSHAGLAAVSEVQVQPRPARSVPHPQRRPQSISDTEAVPNGIRDEDLPEIEARKYPVRARKAASSEQSYLFDDSSDARPMVGRIILLKDGDENVMAFRVIRTFDLEKQFIAKKVRAYGSHRALDLGRELTAIERTQETTLPTHSEFSADEAKDQTELMEGMDEGKVNPDFFGGAGGEPAPTPSPEAPAAKTTTDESLDALDSPEAPSQAKTQPETAAIEKPKAEAAKANDDELAALDDPAEASKVAQLDDQEKAKPLPAPMKEDPELDLADRGGAPAPSKAQPSENEDDDVVVDPGSLLVDDVDPIDLYFHGLTAEFGFLKNNSATGTSTYFSAAGLRYGLTLTHMLFAKSPHVQDSLTLEGGAFHYQVQGYMVSDATNGTDGFSVTPLIGTLRYTLFVSESTAIFFYGGQVYNIAKANGPVFASNTQGEALLGGMQTAAGGGLIFRLGPGWEARADLGMDMFAFGMMLRF